MQEIRKWYAIKTIPKWENKVSASLAKMQIQFYCPMHKVQKQWSDRKKIVLEPLFKSYLFVKLGDITKWQIAEVPGVFGFVQWQGKPAVVREKDIETIQLFLNEFSHTKIEVGNLQPSDTVVITSGLFMDYKGVIVDIAGKKAKVVVEKMGVVLTASFDQRILEKWKINNGEK
jgi:transcription termination/antitermination protein NusG